MRNFFIDSIEAQFKQEGNSMYKNNEEYIKEHLNSSNNEIVAPVNITSIEKGKFYFMFYHLDGKISNWEKFNPLLVVDWFDLDNTRYLYGISLNFIPMNIKVIFFNEIFNGNLKIIENNLMKDITKQEPLKGIDFVNTYKMLSNIGFEWAIRRFDIKYINNVYNINFSSLKEFITMSTIGFTGVDDMKLIEIWKSKIFKQQERHERIIKELLNDYKEMSKDIKKTYNNLQDKNNALEDAMNIINTQF